MIDVWYINTENITPSVVAEMLQPLPYEINIEVMSFLKHEDRRLKLFGKLIVQKYHVFLKEEFSWSNWRTSPNGKPYYNGGKEFNISHSGNMVVVAFSEEKIGVDIQKCVNTDIDSIDNFFHEEEKKNIRSSEDTMDAFHTIWTRKEAYLKAKGIGIGDEVDKENSLEPFIDSNGKWFINVLFLKNNYKSAICSPIKDPEINKRMLVLSEFDRNSSR